MVKLAGIIKSYGPDVIHMHTSRAHFIGACASWIAGAPVRVVTRRMDYPPKGFLIVKLLYTRMVEGVIAISSGVKEALLSIGVPENDVVIPTYTGQVLPVGRQGYLHNIANVPFKSMYQLTV